MHFFTGTDFKRVPYRVKVDTYTALKSTGVYSQAKTSETAQNSSMQLQFKDKINESRYLH